MKKYSVVLAFSMAVSTFLCANQFIYQCTNEGNLITFSESSISGRAVLSYENYQGDNFKLTGNQLTVRRDADRFKVFGTIVDHPRFAGLRASFPMIQTDNGLVTANVTFTYSPGMPLESAAYECLVQRVQF